MWPGSYQGHESENKHSVLTVAPRHNVPIDKYVHHCPTIKNAPWPWLTFSGHFKVTNVKIVYIFLMVQDKHDCGYYETLLGSPYRPFRICKKFTLDNLEEVTWRSRKFFVFFPWFCHPSNSWASCSLTREIHAGPSLDRFNVCHCFSSRL